MGSQVDASVDICLPNKVKSIDISPPTQSDNIFYSVDVSLITRPSCSSSFCEGASSQGEILSVMPLSYNVTLVNLTVRLSLPRTGMSDSQIVPSNGRGLVSGPLLLSSDSSLASSLRAMGWEMVQ